MNKFKNCNSNRNQWLLVLIIRKIIVNRNMLNKKNKLTNKSSRINLFNSNKKKSLKLESLILN